MHVIRALNHKPKIQRILIEPATQGLLNRDRTPKAKGRCLIIRMAELSSLYASLGQGTGTSESTTILKSATDEFLVPRSSVGNTSSLLGIRKYFLFG